MFVVLRIILFVGAIFWLSPLRPGLRPEPRIVPKTLAEAGAHADLAGIERLIEALDMFPVPTELVRGRSGGDDREDEASRGGERGSMARQPP
jgi:hypothetical protein